ncbi:unknown [Prevotella sp. CAG:1124]|nr:unknown [Prevotella sp. CAG:1124]
MVFMVFDYEVVYAFVFVMDLCINGSFCLL